MERYPLWRNQQTFCFETILSLLWLLSIAGRAHSMTSEAPDPSAAAVAPRWDPKQQIYVDGIVPENAEVSKLIEENDGYLRLFGYGSLCWNPGTGALSKPGVVGTPGKAKGYRRCWAQKSTDHRGRPDFQGIVCTLLEDSEVSIVQQQAIQSAREQRKSSSTSSSPTSPTLTEGVIYLVPPEEVDDCLAELDFREKGGYARDVIDVIDDETRETHQAVLYRGTPDNPAFWPRALLDLPFAAAVMSVAEGPSGKNDEYLNRLDDFLSSTHTKEAEQDDTTSLAAMARHFQNTKKLYFLYGCGSNQHNQLLLDRPRNSALLVGGEDAHEVSEIVLCTANPEKVDTSPDIDPPRQIFAGGGHSGLLTQSGKLYLWGWNESGQLGTCQNVGDDGNTGFLTSNPLKHIIVESAALGFSHTLVIERNSHLVLAFGSNERGQLSGVSSNEAMGTPTTPDFLRNSRVKAVAAGLFHSAVVTEDGEVITFGCSRFGQSLPVSSDEKAEGGNESFRRWKPDDGSRIESVACGRRHTVALDSRGRLWTWGENKYGQLGRQIDGKMDPLPALVEDWVPAPFDYTTLLSCGWSHTVVDIVSPEGEHQVFGWGRNDKGQLGLGNTSSQEQLQRLFRDFDSLEAITCGSESTVVLSGDGEIWGCGWNEHGNLATGKINDQLCLCQAKGSSVLGPPGLYDGKVTIAAGGAHLLSAKVSR